MREGEVLALLGANGAGKTTAARAISGMLPATAGEIDFDGERIDGRGRTHRPAAASAHCMEGRRIFADLTVEENLLLGGRAAAAKAERTRRMARGLRTVPELRERAGTRARRCRAASSRCSRSAAR